MTALASCVFEKAMPDQRPPSLLFLLPNTILAFLFPGLTRAWTRVSLLRAFGVAFCNTLAAGIWAVLIILASFIWRDVPPAIQMHAARQHMAATAAAGAPVTGAANPMATPESVWSLQAFESAGLTAWDLFRREWSRANFFDRYSPFVALLGIILAAYLLPYFVILPFAARPGPNKVCLRHVTRTVLLGSGVVHWWGLAYVLILLAYSSLNMPSLAVDYAQAVTPLLLAFSVLSIWTLLVLGRAARHEYRTPAQHAEPHDPWCDDCGYTLTGIDPAGRCPECGRPIAESIGPHNRPPTPWEVRPTLSNRGVIAAQVRAIVLRPRSLFFSMPTLTGQRAAQRWLLASAVVLFVLALPIVPALYVALDAEWNFAVVASSLAMGLAWAVFGLMMVGVETAGIATFSRLRKHKVYLSTASKVTSYSALLMAPWIFLGGIQLVAYTYLSVNHDFLKVFHLGLRGEQVALAASLSLAHIGGLLWYELTVYRGIRAIQYANK